jgi:drug/metabolite transporter (DMT)-like permease
MYGKAAVAILAAILVAVQAATGGDHHVEPDEWVQIAIAAVGAVGVYMVPLTTRYKWTKTAVAFLLAALQTAATVLLGGWEVNDWITVVIAGLGAVGVLIAPATSVDPSGAGNVAVPLGPDR